jgi:hypothetical protein
MFEFKKKFFKKKEPTQEIKKNSTPLGEANNAQKEILHKYGKSMDAPRLGAESQVKNVLSSRPEQQITAKINRPDSFEGTNLIDQQLEKSTVVDNKSNLDFKNIVEVITNNKFQVDTILDDSDFQKFNQALKQFVDQVRSKHQPNANFNLMKLNLNQSLYKLINSKTIKFANQIDAIKFKSSFNELLNNLIKNPNKNPDIQTRRYVGNLNSIPQVENEIQTQKSKIESKDESFDAVTLITNFIKSEVNPKNIEFGIVQGDLEVAQFGVLLKEFLTSLKSKNEVKPTVNFGEFEPETNPNFGLKLVSKFFGLVDRNKIYITNNTNGIIGFKRQFQKEFQISISKLSSDNLQNV